MADLWFLGKRYSTKSKTGETVFVWLFLLLDTAYFLQPLYIKLFNFTLGYLSANHRSANWFSNKNNG